MEEMSRISIDSIKVGSCYSEPVYFEDGKNMFLPGNYPAQEYHITVLRRWHIPFLLTNGVPVQAPAKKSEKELVSVGQSASSNETSDVEDLLPV